MVESFLVGMSEKSNRSGTKYYENDSGDVVAKQCTKCSQIKPTDSFRDSKKGFAGKYAYCITCQKSYTRKWKESNRDHIKQYRERNKGSISEYRRSYYELNREKELENNKVRKESNREAYNTYNRNRRARNSRLKGNLTEVQRREIMVRFENKCALSGDAHDIQLDHVIPIASGHGGTIYENMIPLRADLNNSKNDKCIFDWFADNQERFDLPQQRFDDLIEYLAEINEMTTTEYEGYVRWCHDNPRELKEEIDEVVGVSV